MPQIAEAAEMANGCPAQRKCVVFSEVDRMSMFFNVPASYVRVDSGLVFCPSGSAISSLKPWSWQICVQTVGFTDLATLFCWFQHVWLPLASLDICHTLGSRKLRFQGIIALSAYQLPCLTLIQLPSHRVGPSRRLSSVCSALQIRFSMRVLQDCPQLSPSLIAKLSAPAVTVNVHASST